MCFQIDRACCKERQIADKDIICYKFLKKYMDGLSGPYYHFIYELGKEYSLPERFQLKGKGGYNRINVGFHSFIDESEIKNKTKKEYNLGDDVAVRCIIPKGSYYWYNNYEFVANKIIIKEVIYKTLIIAKRKKPITPKSKKI